MTDTLNLYKGEELVKSEEYVEGKAELTIDSLDANTDYPKGIYQVSRENENGESEKVDVPAFKTKPIAVTGVKLNKESTSLEVGANETLNATVSPSTATNKKVTYTSSDDAVATVDNNGKVIAIKAGSTDITVTTEDGSKSAKCSVTVTEPEPDPEPDLEETEE